MAFLPDIVRRLGVEPGRIRRISARANIHWAVRSADGGRFVLRRFGAGPERMDDIAWEGARLTALLAAGLPVAAPRTDPIRIDGRVWAIYRRLPGRPLAPSNTDEAGYRALGRALADYHAVARTLSPPPQRPGWRPYAECFAPPADGPGRGALLDRLARTDPGQAEAFGKAAEALQARRLPSVLEGLPVLAVHGDFSPWNLLMKDGAVSGILDFEAAHLDAAAADLAFARRGSHDAVVWGYLERQPLSDAELAALDGLWTGAVLHGVWTVLAAQAGGIGSLDWNFQQLGKTRPYRAAPA